MRFFSVICSLLFDKKLLKYFQKSVDKRRLLCYNNSRRMRDAMSKHKNTLVWLNGRAADL